MSKLENRDFTIAIDRSGSMTLDYNGRSRWDNAGEATLALAKKAATFDPDGIDIILFGSKATRLPDQTPEKVVQVFKEYEPMGTTNLSGALDVFFATYFENRTLGKAKENGALGVFITDGMPNSKQECVRSITEATKQMRRDGEIGITFIQIGNDGGAKEFLTYLDDELSDAKYDIVDTISIDECEDLPLTEVLLRAIED